MAKSSTIWSFSYSLTSLTALSLRSSLYHATLFPMNELCGIALSEPVSSSWLSYCSDLNLDVTFHEKSSWIPNLKSLWCHSTMFESSAQSLSHTEFSCSCFFLYCFYPPKGVNSIGYCLILYWILSAPEATCSMKNLVHESQSKTATPCEPF